MTREEARALIVRALARAYHDDYDDAEEILMGMVDALLAPEAAKVPELSVDAAYQEALDISLGR